MPRLPWGRIGRGLAIGLLGVALWPLLASSSDAVFRAVANGTVGNLTFGSGGHVAFYPAAPREVSDDHDDDASWSTLVELRVDGIPVRDTVRVNARRLLYLPSVLLAAVVLASPLSARRKSLALAIGSAVLIGAALLSTWLLAAWLFALAPGLVYDLSSFEKSALRFGYEAWDSALGNRFITPLFVSATLVLLLSSPGKLDTAAPAPAKSRSVKKKRRKVSARR